MGKGGNSGGGSGAPVVNYYDVRQFYFGNFDDLDPIESSPGEQNIFNEYWGVDGWNKGREFTIDDGLRVVDITQNDTVRDKAWGYHDKDETRLEENDYKNYWEYDRLYGWID